MPDAAQIEADLIGWLSGEIFDPSMKLDAGTDLIGAGFDSMALVRLVLFAEDQYAVQIPEARITEEVLRNARSLASFIAGILDGHP